MYDLETDRGKGWDLPLSEERAESIAPPWYSGISIRRCIIS
jgi:hypothetical protein